MVCSSLPVESRIRISPEGKLARFCAAALTFFQSAEGEALLDVFCFWATEKSSDGPDRLAALRKLQTNLLAKSDNAESIVRAFILEEIYVNGTMPEHMLTIFDACTSILQV
jgi:hypothetical protein